MLKAFVISTKLKKISPKILDKIKKSGYEWVTTLEDRWKALDAESIYNKDVTEIIRGVQECINQYSVDEVVILNVHSIGSLPDPCKAALYAALVKRLPVHLIPKVKP